MMQDLTRQKIIIVIAVCLIELMFHGITAFSLTTKLYRRSISDVYFKGHLHPMIKNINRKQITVYAVDSESSSEQPLEDEFDWEQIAADVFKNDKRPVILFDGVCNLCNGGVNFALDNDSVGKLRFASLQSTIGKSLLIRSGKDIDDISSIVLVTEDESYFKSDAVLRIASKLDGSVAFPVIGAVGRVLPPFMRNFVYDVVATNRYRFGESEQCRLDFGEFDDRFFNEPTL